MNRAIIIHCFAVIFAAAAHKAAAVTVTQDNDATNLAAALAPSPGSGVTVTGVFTEASNVQMLGNFTGGNSTIGFSDGIVLSTGNVTQIAFPASGLDTGFAGSPTSNSTLDLINSIPTVAGSFHDTVRLSLTIDPGLLNNYVNFSLGFLSNEISESDRFGVFLDDTYFGFLSGSPISMSHPWIFASVSNIGFASALYLDGDGTNPESFLVSIAIPSPGVSFTLDFVLVDVFGDSVDTAVFLGNLTLSETPLGVVMIPEPGTLGLLALAGSSLLLLRRRRAANV